LLRIQSDYLQLSKSGISRDNQEDSTPPDDIVYARIARGYIDFYSGRMVIIGLYSYLTTAKQTHLFWAPQH